MNTRLNCDKFEIGDLIRTSRNKSAKYGYTNYHALCKVVEINYRDEYIDADIVVEVLKSNKYDIVEEGIANNTYPVNSKDFYHPSIQEINTMFI